MTTLALTAVFFAGALCEELDWSGYVLDPLQDRWGAWRAGLILGSVWVVWHILPLLQAHRPPAFIAWWSLGTLADRLIMVWLYNRTGRSVFAMALYHAMENVTWQLFPIDGSYYDPRVSGLITAAVATAVVAFSLFGARRPDTRRPARKRGMHENSFWLLSAAGFKRSTGRH